MKINRTPLTSKEDIETASTILENSDTIAFDTEFIREKTYWSKLCLIQIATKEQAFIIDVLSKDISLDPILDIILKPNVTKIVHAGFQDVEIIYDLTGKVVPNVHDTQIMARLCTRYYQISLGDLIYIFCSERMEKNLQLSDWARRPLNRKQCEYALADVTYLHRLDALLMEKISEFDRLELLENETKRVYDPENFTLKASNAWQKIKFSSVSDKKLAVLKELAEWREKQAMRRNLPRQHIISDNLIMSIVKMLPRNMDELNKIRNLPSSFKQGDKAKMILKTVNNQKTIIPMTLATPSKNKLNEANDVLPLLSILLELTAKQNSIAPNMIASSQDLKEITRENISETLFDKWKWEIFGQNAQKLLNGELAITCENNKLQIVSNKEVKP